MKALTLALTLTLAAAGCAAPAVAARNDLEARVSATDGWVAYSVPMVADAGEPCCYSMYGGAAKREGCDLDGRTWNFGSGNDADRVTPGVGHVLSVYLRVDHGQIARVRAIGASCPVHSASPVRAIDPVDPDDSVQLLASLLDRSGMQEEDDYGLAAIAYHATASATQLLAARAAPAQRNEARKQALFWLGQTRGAAGADVVEHYATTDASPALRAHAVFALSQSDAGNAYEHIRTIASNDPSEQVRSQALFWMAQMGDARAEADITTALHAEAAESVREQAVFALSQLEDERADAALIAVIRGNYPRAIKKKALFWLGQSGSPQALAFFDDALR
jgi:HEAT repeats